MTDKTCRKLWTILDILGPRAGVAFAPLAPPPLPRACEKCQICQNEKCILILSFNLCSDAMQLDCQENAYVLVFLFPTGSSNLDRDLVLPHETPDDKVFHICRSLVYNGKYMDSNGLLIIPT